MENQRLITLLILIGCLAVIGFVFLIRRVDLPPLSAEATDTTTPSEETSPVFNDAFAPIKPQN